MEIRNKTLFKKLIKNKIDKYIREFPLFFCGNIIINALLISALVIIVIISATLSGFLFYGIFFLIVILGFLEVTIKNFLRNITILKNILENYHTFGNFKINDHEMDNVVELMEDLPKNKEEIDHLKLSLSFDKLIEILTAARIISYHKKTYEIDLKFKYKFELLEADSNMAEK